jgi:hypothetical protein
MNFPPQGRPRLLSTPFVRAPPMRFRSAHTKLPNRVAYMTTRENSSSDHLCQIVPVKRASMKVSVAIGGSLDRISHHALPFFARASEGRSRRAAPPSVVRDSGYGHVKVSSACWRSDRRARDGVVEVNPWITQGTVLAVSNGKRPPCRAERS